MCFLGVAEWNDNEEVMIGGVIEEIWDVAGLSMCYQCGRRWVDNSSGWSKKPCRCSESIRWKHSSQIPDAMVTWDEREEK